jgi:hypothetical protein
LFDETGIGRQVARVLVAMHNIPLNIPLSPQVVLIADWLSNHIETSPDISFEHLRLILHLGDGTTHLTDDLKFYVIAAIIEEIIAAGPRREDVFPYNMPEKDREIVQRIYNAAVGD